jgi:hypothetical protein
MPNAQNIRSRALAQAMLALTVLAMTSLAAGCGVWADMARDNEFHIGSLGLKDFISPAKLRVGILNFRDEVGLGAPDAGANMANLVTERFAENGDLIMVQPADVSAAAIALGWAGDELTPELAMRLGRELNLNVVMDGAISQVEQQSGRRGWRRLVRYFTDQRTYVDAVLSMLAYDAATGLVVSSRAAEGSYKVGETEDEDPFFASAPAAQRPIPQEAIEAGLDDAVNELYYRTLDGLAYTPFKARVTSENGKTATIPFGQDVGLKRGVEFVALSEKETVTSSIDVQYVIPGESKARLKVTDVGPDQSTLEIQEGGLNTGDFIQAWTD